MDSPIYNPALPYLTHITGGFGPGRMLRFQGVPHPSARCFAINLLYGGNSNPRDDIALHFSPVFTPPPRVVRNSLQSGSWGPEESHGSYFPLTPGQSCEILILSESNRFMIAINGEHFCEFYHRIPLQRVTHLGIDGEITVTMFKFDGTATPYGATPAYDHVPMPQPYSSMPTVPQPYVPMPTGHSYPTGGHQGYPVQSYASVPGQGYYPGTSVVYPKSPGKHHKGLMSAAAGVGTALAGAAVGHKMHKKSSPIPIGSLGMGLAGAGAGALGAAALMGHSPFKPKKLKKLYKHKHFKHKHKWGGHWHGRSSSSSSD